MTEIFIGRQAIFNRKMEVYAYELLYRSCETNAADFSDPDLATTQVTLNTIIEMGLNKIINKSKAFINLTRNFIVGNYPILLPPNRTVIEIPENIETDDELISALRALHKDGYAIALDDVMALERISPYQDIATLVKLDLKLIDPQALPDLIRSVKAQGFLVLAEKVETMEEFKLCHDLGVDYFQGYFLCKPNIIQSKKMDSSRLVIMRALAMIQNPKTSFSELEQMISQDVGLCYKILRLTNSGYYSFISEVKSIRQAISLIGTETVRGWLSLLMMTQLNDKPIELTNIALQRAYMAESLARVLKHPQPEVCFLVGLFSVLDALLDQPMEKIVQEINLSQSVADALLYNEGLPGYILSMVINYERGEWTNVKYPNMLVETISNIYFDSIKWTNIIFQEISGNLAVDG
ncbi:MAG: hypothetical protein CVU42_06790 [Chloroflexi bacterium HGW-Chloroflexi-4]|jgi:EAL and modified HD-GYP domain-containing signal transduction protein|nr:MAG: hypothetical protein CVU42_06790 [Chloroflexi bacterium HGW-Chloroflexi-4]